jgi:hypothetical protein
MFSRASAVSLETRMIVVSAMFLNPVMVVDKVLLICLWFAPQPACNPNQTQALKSNRQPSPLEDDEQGRHSLLLNTRKQKWTIFYVNRFGSR